MTMRKGPVELTRRSSHRGTHESPAWWLGAAVLTAMVAVAGCQTVIAQTRVAQAPKGAAGAPNLNVGAAEFPEDDAIILRWEQHWALDADGTVHRRDHKWFKFLNARPIRANADPRIDFCDGPDELVIHTAQTILPDGTTMPVPEYSYNEAGPDDVAGWPEYIAWKQMVVSFSAIQDDAVTELDYEVITKPGVVPWIDADLQMHQDYPTLDRIVSVTLPRGTVLHHRVDGLDTPPEFAEQSTDGGTTTFSWQFRNLAGVPGEPQSWPWQQRCGRLRFTTCRRVHEWVAEMIKRVDSAAQPDEAIQKFAVEVTKDKTTPGERVRAVAEKVRDTFNFVNSPKAMRSFQCRGAADVFRTNYGNPLESAATCLAALRAAGIEAKPVVAVDATKWEESVPTRSAFAGVAIVAEGADGSVYIHPEHGVFRNPGAWGRRWLLGADAAGSLSKTYVSARGETRPSELRVAGKITIDEDAKVSGELRVQLTGAFYDPLKLEESDSQEKLVKKIVGCVLSDVDVGSHSIAALSDDVLTATVQVATEDAIQKVGERYILRFGDGPASLADFPMPLDRSYRKTNVHLAGTFREVVDVTVELPEKWAVAIAPSSLSEVRGGWGTIGQVVAVDGHVVRFRRSVSLTTDTVSPMTFATIRDAVNRLRTDACLLLAFDKK